MAGDDFNACMDKLAASVGVGKIAAEVVVDQVYAKYQELRDDLVLHGGGRHHYTRDALFDNVDRIMELWAEHLLTADGSDIHAGTERVAELVARDIFQQAPFEFGDLKASPHPICYDDGQVFYDRAPAMHRLSKDELRAKNDLRRLGLGNHMGDDEIDHALGNFA